MKQSLFFFTIILLINSTIIATKAAEYPFTEELLGVHPKGGLLYNGYNANFQSFEGAVDCGIFETGNGLGWSGALFLEKYIGNDFLVGLGVAYTDRSGELTVENRFPSRDLSTNQIVTITTENFITSSLSYIEFQPEFRWIALDKLINGPLRTLAALRFYIPMTKNFEQKERIVSPDNAVFINAGDVRTQQRDISGGEMTSISGFGMGLTFGVENMLKISDKNFLTQQLAFDYNFGNVTNDAEWSIWAVRFEVGLRFSVFNAEEEEIEYIPIEVEEEPEVEIIVEEKPEPPTLDLAITSVRDMKLNVGEELLATIPIVNAVFFDRNSSEIPDFYSTKALQDDNFFRGDPVENHKFIIPKIAYLMKKNPDATIIIESATSGAENEPEGLKLANQRASEIKKAFLDLGIAESKIKIQARLAPIYLSNQEFPEGVIENQRADILLINAPLQEFVDIRTYSELQGNIDVDVDFENLPPTDNVSIFNDVADTIFAAPRTGKYEIKVKQRVDVENQSVLPINTTARAGKLSKTETSEVDLSSLPVENKELTLDNFEAVLRFNYNSNDLSYDTKILLKQLTEKLPSGATIYIIGSTDILGTTERNIELANERAASTENYLKSVAGNKFTITTSIATTDKFSDETPQGRFLNRSIKIRVKK
jgi:outer membrane protein OmpA-like peptidoglycan-associated protein